MADLEEVERRVLARMSTSDAYWTADIAHDARLGTTGAARTQLEKLLKKGLVERGVQGAAGRPSSWRRTEAGTAALRALKETQHVAG